MRITNKIMQRNNLNNININKVLEDKLTSQLSTEKKISRPSDDPVIAIRALRLRSNVTEVSQYYEKNVKDAESWLKVTEDALASLSTVITNMQSSCTTGANGDLTSSDRKIILEQLQAYSDEIYKTGDADYAGRYVFTGYRTDTPLSFQEQTKRQYSITQQMDKTVIDTVTHVNTDNMKNWNASNFASIEDLSGTELTEQDITESTVYRIRLAYNECDTGVTPSITYYDSNGNEQTLSGITEISVNDTNDPYSQVAAADTMIAYVPETGEILLGKNAYNTLMATKDNANTSAINEGEIRITYQKTNFESTDLRPEHYFYCKATDYGSDGTTLDTSTTIEYNEDYLDSTLERQPIEYDVGFNATIRINSTADECFNLDIGREVDDLVAAMQNVVDLEAIKDEMDKTIAATTDETELATLNKQYAALEKALTYATDVCQTRFEQGITAMQGFLDKTSLAITNNGTRGSKLELIESRLQNQKTTFETLQSENEDVDITEVAINLSSAETTYEAALMATGKIMQNTLLNYI